MNNRNHLIHSVVCLAMMASASAAPVIWSAPQAISNSAEVVTSGTLVIARQGNSGTSQTVHGVSFDSSNNTQNGVTFSLTGNAEYWSNVFLGTKALAGTDGTAYGNALNGAWYNDGGNMTASLSGLTVGNSYLIQFWVADFRQFTNDRRLSIAGSGDLSFLGGDGIHTDSGRGHFVTGTFTADATTQDFLFTDTSPTQSTTMLNAFQVRDLTPPVPLRPPSLAFDSIGQVTLRWPSSAGNVYQLENSSDLVKWETLADAVRADTGSTAWLDPAAVGQTRRFYRLSKLAEYPVRSGFTALDQNGLLNLDRTDWLARNNLVYNAPPVRNTESIPLGSGRVGAAMWLDPVNGLTAHLNRPEGVPAMAGLGTLRIRNLANLALSPDYKGVLSLHDGTFTQRAGLLTVVSFFRWGGEELVVDVQGAAPEETVTVELSTYANTHNAIAGATPADETTGADCIAVCGADGTSASYPGFRATQFLAAKAAGRSVVAATTATGATLTFKPNLNGSYRLVVPVKIWTGTPVNLSTLKAEALAATAAFPNLATDPFASLAATQSAAFGAMWDQAAIIRLASKDGKTRLVEQMLALDTYFRISGALTPLPATGGGDTRLFSWNATGAWNRCHWYQNLRPINYANLASGVWNANYGTWNRLLTWLPTFQQHVLDNFPGYEGAGFPESIDGQPGTAGKLMVSEVYGHMQISPVGDFWYHSRMMSTTLEIIATLIAEYRYRQDEAFLTTHWPLVEQGMLFHRSLLMSGGLGADGRYHYYRVNSRENNWDDDDDTPDVANIRTLVPLVIELARQRGATQLVTKLNDLVGKLPEIPTTTRSGLAAIAWSAVTRDTGHNEENPDLDAIWPANAIGDASDPALVQLAQNTLDTRVYRESYDWHPTAVQAARMGRADIYQSALLAGIGRFMNYPQGFGTFDGVGRGDVMNEFTAVQTYATHEALVQNYDGLLRLANAWPADWEAIAWLPTEGGHWVAVEVADGKLQAAAVHLGSSNPAMRIRNPWPGEIFSVRDLTNSTLLHNGNPAIATVGAVSGHRLLIERASQPLSSFVFEPVVDFPNNGPTVLGGRTLGKATARQLGFADPHLLEWKLDNTGSGLTNLGAVAAANLQTQGTVTVDSSLPGGTGLSFESGYLRTGVLGDAGAGVAATFDLDVKPDAGGGYRRLIDYATPGSNATTGFVLDLTPANNVRFICGGALATSTASVPAGAWSHVRVIYRTGTSITIEIGATTETITGGGGPIDLSSSTLHLSLGADLNGSSRFSGSIANVRIQGVAE